MPRPKKIISDVPEAPKRRGRPPKNRLLTTAPPAPAKEASSKKPRKYQQSSTLTCRLDGKLRARLNKVAKQEFTSVSSLVNKYIDLGLSTEPHRLALVDRRLAVIEKTLGIVIAEAIAAEEAEDVGDDAGAVVDDPVSVASAGSNGSSAKAPPTAEQKANAKPAESKQA